MVLPSKAKSLTIEKMRLQALRSYSPPYCAVTGISNCPFHHFNRAILSYFCNYKDTISEVLSNQKPQILAQQSSWLLQMKVLATIFITRKKFQNKNSFGDFLLKMLFWLIRNKMCIYQKSNMTSQYRASIFFMKQKTMLLHWRSFTNLS